MKFEIYKEFMSQSSHFKPQLDLVRLGELDWETGNLGNCSEWRDWEGNLVGGISIYCRYLIDVTRLDPLSLGEPGRGSSALATLVLLDMLGQ